MSVNPSPMRRAFICPLCGTPIDAMTPQETVNAPAPKDWDYEADHGNMFERQAKFANAQNMEANEALIWAHFESHHNLREAVLALGAARQALFDINALCVEVANQELIVTDEIQEVVERGLGNK